MAHPHTHPSSGDHTKEFNFLGAVVTVSVLTVILLFAYSILFLTPSFTALIAENTEATAILVGTHIKDDIFPADTPFAKESLPPGFKAEITQIVDNFHMMKIKVFAPNGETIFSTETKDIGVMNEHDYFHQQVAMGKPFTKVVKKDGISLEGQQVTTDLVETYVPALANNGAFMGAFEIYLDITTPKAKLDLLVNRSNHLLQAISAGLLLAMLFIAHRARANILARRTAEEKIIKQSVVLEETNKDLSIINEISAVINRSIDMDRLLPGILDTIAARFTTFSEVSRGGIFLLAGDKLILTSHLGHDDEFMRQHQGLTINDCRCGQAARTGEIIFSANSAHDPGHTLCSCIGRPHGHIIIPLTAQDKVLGVLYLYTAVNAEISDKENLLQSIGRQIGLAINNASLYQQTRHLALHDQLTGLPNRRAMELRLAEAVNTAERYGRPLSLAMMDIDFFKRYNDTMGHAAGDRILTNVGAMIRKEIREADFAARYGGEEFLLILAETDRCGACIGVERIRKTIEQKGGVTISVGVTSYRTGLGVEKMIKEADDALYRAKDNGRNRVEWSTSLKPCHETAS
jgi:diguanylate cyclase (GGDEF)-like protein